MSRALLLVVVVSMLALTGIGDDGISDERAQSSDPEPIKYQVTSLKGKLFHELDQGSTRLAVGAQLQSGDQLRTGWFSEAEIVAPEWATSFRMAPRTRVRLAGERPGLLLEVEQGRVRATFDPLPESTTAGDPESAAAAETSGERIITTPSVILAVRGTDYSVAVDNDGSTTVAVYSGEVEAVDIDQSSEPVLIGEGYSCTIRRGHGPESPRRHRWRAGDWNKVGMPGAQRRGQGGGMDGRAPQGGGQQQRRHGGGGSSRHGG